MPRVTIALTHDGGRHWSYCDVIKPVVRLRYLKGSKQMGLRLWDVLAPRVAGYIYTPDNGFPTFSLDTLKEKGLI